MNQDHTYVKKPIAIQAFQMTPERRKDNSEWPQWLHEAWNKNDTDEGALIASDYPNSDGADTLLIQTLEGTMAVGWGDWIIQGVNGEIYPCKDDIFQKSYEKPIKL